MPEFNGMYYDDYAEFQRDLDDRDDTYDPEFRDPDGYCEHGWYVGGCGADLMCGDCEMGISAAEARLVESQQRTRVVRERAETAGKLLAIMLMHGVSGMDAAHIAQESQWVNNPRSRYGRH
jgi:hypothetical protein